MHAHTHLVREETLLLKCDCLKKKSSTIEYKQIQTKIRESPPHTLALLPDRLAPHLSQPSFSY